MSDESKSLFDYQPDSIDENAELNWDDDRITTVLERTTQGSIKFFRNAWRAYERELWSERDVEEVRLIIRVFLRKFRRKGVEIKRGQVTSIEAMFRDAAFVPDRVLTELEKEQQLYIPLRNGLFNIETWKLEPNRRELYFTNQLDFDYDEDADAPVFRQYLRTSLVKPDFTPDYQLYDFCLEALAYSMTARVDEKASFWLYGVPDSGKSTFLGFIADLMGSLHVTIDLNQMGTNQFMLSALVGKRIATFAEAEVGTVLPDGIYKAISGGGDPIWTDVKNRQGISFIPQAKLWWGMNTAPRTRDRSSAIFNRLKIIPFNRSIPRKERDGNLKKKLRAEKSGIFNELVVAYKRFSRRGGFDIPDQSKQALEKYRLQNDTERTFLLECVKQDANGRIQASELYIAYKEWCMENGFRHKQRNEVSADWERLGLKQLKSDGRHYWTGGTLIVKPLGAFL